MPKVFGIEHLIFTAVFLLLSVGSLIIIKKYLHTKKSVDIAVKIAAGLLLMSIIWNRISISVYSKDAIDLIPDSACGATSLLFSLCVLLIPNKNHNVFHFLIYVAFLGGALNTVYPEYIGQAASVFHMRTISGLTHHAISLYLAVMLFVTGDFKPNLKKWWCFVLGLCAYMTYGLFMIQALDRTNSMYINKPLLENSPFSWYFVGVLYIALQIAFLLCYEFIFKRQIFMHQRKKVDQNREN